MHHGVTMRAMYVAWRALTLASFLGLAGLSGCDDVGDQLCPVGTDPNDLGDKCPYGPAQEPQITDLGCPEIPQTDVDCSLSFANDVWPLLTTEAGNLGAVSCVAGGCHAPPAGGNPDSYSPPRLYDDAAQTYDALLKVINKTSGEPYISNTSPGKVWILCNLRGSKGGGARMPQGNPLPATAIETVEKWASCGQPLGASSGTGGAGGSM